MAKKVKSPASPASRVEGPPSVAVFGAGIAGLTAAHELSERGFDVTVYEGAADSRTSIDHYDDEGVPDVKLGGLASTQYVSGKNLRPFPGREDLPKPPRVATGEHGFRFFPSYYLHVWDTLRRIPIYEKKGEEYVATARTVYDNVRRVVAQAGTASRTQPSLIIPREAPRSVAELVGSYQEMMLLGFTVNDLSTFFGRMARYLFTSPERRAAELEEMSAYDYLVGRDPATGKASFKYSKLFDEQIRKMPRILAAFDVRYGDARTNLSTYVQLNMSLDRYDSKADGVLNGPTTDAWFDPWYRHLCQLGVKFERASLVSFDRAGDGALRAWITRETGALDKDAELDDEAALTDPDRVAEEVLEGFDYFVVATDAFRAELATAQLRRLMRDDPEIGAQLVSDVPPEDTERRRTLRNLSTVLGLDGFATLAPPEDGPFALNVPRRRNPLIVDEMGRKPWDRFQTLSGIQFFFDTDFQVLQGHVYYGHSKWGLSSINPTGLWMDKPRLKKDGYVSIMSVDVGEWRTRSKRADKMSAAECSEDQLASEVWRQISTELAASLDERDAALPFPQPRWYSIDTFLGYGEDPDTGQRRPLVNRAPYLIPIVRDWKNRPGAYPWNPSGSSPTWRPNKRLRREQRRLGVWQARHGGYQVHFDKLVFAGTWCKTFTRMTSMEAACESGRHAVNAILDHYLYTVSGRTDNRKSHPLSWRMPYGFVDQELSSPIRFPSPAGDYCFIYDCENREPGDARTTRMVDAEYFHAGLAHPWTVFGVDRAAAAMSDMGSDRPSTNLYDPSWLTDQVRQWRVMVESVFGDGVPGTPPSPKGPRSAKSDGARATGVPGLKCIVARHGGSKFDLNDWEVAEPW